MRVLLDAGHGLFKDEQGHWKYDRPMLRGIREDLLTPSIVKEIAQILEASGHTVFCTRPSPQTPEGEEKGPSGNPRWMEGSLYWLRSVLDGHPQYQETGRSEWAKCRNIRPYYGKIMSVDLAISIHNDAAKREGAHGTTVFFPSHGLDRELSKRLALYVYNEIVVNNGEFNGLRGIKGKDPKKWAWFRRRKPNIPCVLVEFLFTTNKRDNALLHESTILSQAARSMAEGILTFEKEEL